MDIADMENVTPGALEKAPNTSETNFAHNRNTVRMADAEPGFTDEDSTANGLMKFGICLGMVFVVLGAIANWERLESFRIDLECIRWMYIVLLAGFVFGAVKIAALIWRIILVSKYRPEQGCSDGMLPSCSVIVPAYNEGKLVLSTLRSLAASNYPVSKLQLIAIDDGSVDDTWEWMCKAKEELGDRLTIFQQSENRGKRHALHAGFSISRGDVLVTVDSDSVVLADTLRNLVSPFVQDKKVGAVAGNVRVLNRKKGPIPRMLDVVFVYSFDFIRASQSMVNTVMCTPGALSAYRHSVVKKVLQEWLGQKFFGRAANIGEDRAMTNLILREGYYVHFQQNAMVYTNVPTNHRTLSKMFLRWARSNIRETIVMCRFAFRRFRHGSMLGARINLLLSLLILTKSPTFLIVTLGLFIWRPVEVGLHMLLGIIFFSSLPAAMYLWKYRSSDALWAYGYSVIWLFSLSWITPYALLTPHKAGWLTRQIKSNDNNDTVETQTHGCGGFVMFLLSIKRWVTSLALPVRTVNVRRSRTAVRQFFSL